VARFDTFGFRNHRNVEGCSFLDMARLTEKLKILGGIRSTEGQWQNMINIPGFPGLYSGLTRGAGSLTFNEEV
jgi:hypothetical protein